MVTVGFRDIYRYGGRFLGYLFVIGGLAGVFLAGGAYLASQTMALSDPSVSDLSQTRAFVGVLAMAIGAVLGTVGFFGLAHKLLTESMEVALAAHEAELTVSPATTRAGTADDRAPPESEQEADPELEQAVPESEEDAPSEPATDGPPSRQPTPPESVADEGSGDQSEGREPVGTELVVSDPESAGESESVAGQDPSDPAGDANAETIGAVETSPPPAEESTDENRSAPGPDVADGSDPAEPASGDTADDSPPVWTPPDPSEFETNDEPKSDDSADQVAGDTESGPAVDPEEVPEDETLADQGVDSFLTGGEHDPLADRLPGDEE